MVIIFVESSDKMIDLLMTDEEELKARIEAAEDDLLFFSLYEDDIIESGFSTQEELENSINETLDDYIDAKRKLNER